MVTLEKEIQAMTKLESKCREGKVTLDALATILGKPELNDWAHTDPSIESQSIDGLFITIRFAKVIVSNDISV